MISKEQRRKSYKKRKGKRKDRGRGREKESERDRGRCRGRGIGRGRERERGKERGCQKMCGDRVQRQRFKEEEGTVLIEFYFRAGTTIYLINEKRGLPHKHEMKNNIDKNRKNERNKKNKKNKKKNHKNKRATIKKQGIFDDLSKVR